MADISFIEMQPGDVKDTWSGTSDLTALIGYAPEMPLETGTAKFVK